MSLRPLRNLASSLFGLALVIAASLGIVWPVWYAATEWTEWYTVAAVLAIVLAAVYGIVTRVRGRNRRES
jgi:multidrug resistance efflux pump